MPIRSSVCTYSPLAAASHKYSPSSTIGTGSSGRFSASSSVLPSSASSYGHYKPLDSCYSPSRYASTNPLSASRYGPSSTSYSPTFNSSTTSIGLYRPLRTSSPSACPNTTRSSFTTPSGSRRAYTPAASQRYSVSNLSLSSVSSADYLSPSRHGNQSSSAYSSASLSSSASSTNSHYNGATSYTSPRTRRLSYTGSSLSSVGSYSGASSQYTAIETIPEGVPVGLINLGNTCYMNASLQALYSLEAFRNLLLAAHRRSSTDTSKQLTSELGDLFSKMKESSTQRQRMLGLSPTSFKQTFARYQTKFSNFGQQDAQEFLRYLINGIHEESNQASKRPRRRSPVATNQSQAAPRNSADAWSQYRSIVDDSPFVDLLVGQLCSTITCSQCQHKSHCWDPFWDLSLPLIGARAQFSCELSDLLSGFIAKETLDSDERPICEHCKAATKSTKQISFARMPKVLILHLKKFTNDGFKLTTPSVRIETELRIPDSKAVYSLKACISHHGHSSSSGHYTSHCEYSARWFHFDDDRVRDVSSSFIGSGLDDAYVLFYTLQPTSHQSKL